MKSVGYCTNVHPGNSLDEVKKNLEQFALPVRDAIVESSESLGIGLWLSESTSNELVESSSQESFRDWLLERRLSPYTFNGFPFGDFHQRVVKHSVYSPTWAERSRLEYTQRLAEIQSVIFAGRLATISTLPLGWPHKSNSSTDFLIQCGRHLIEISEYLFKLEEETGKQIVVCLEPEPGCIFDTAIGLVEFFEAYVFSHCDDKAEQRARRHLGVCHDVCHSAVMYESQHDAVKAYSQAGIPVAKTQISSAVEAEFDAREPKEKTELLKRLKQFVEPRYLHQTSVRSDGKVKFFEDLPLAIAAAENSEPCGLWRVHFHIPICQDKYGLIDSTQSDISEFMQAISKFSVSPQLEVETYAWNVLPAELQNESLDASIIRELDWFNKKFLTSESGKNW